MKTYVRILFLFTLLLSPALSRAEIRSVKHNFQTLDDNKQIEFTGNTIGKANSSISVTYTCSSGARFYSNAYSGNKIAIFLDATNAQVVTSQITDLDSLTIRFNPLAHSKTLLLHISEDGVSWTSVALVDGTSTGVKVAKLPRAGTYYVRLKRDSHDLYIREIEYSYVDLSDCPNCFVYKP